LAGWLIARRKDYSGIFEAHPGKGERAIEGTRIIEGEKGPGHIAGYKLRAKAGSMGGGGTTSAQIVGKKGSAKPVQRGRKKRDHCHSSWDP